MHRALRAAWRRLHRLADSVPAVTKRLALLCALLLCAGLLAGTGLWNSRKPDAVGNGAGQTAVSAPDAKGTPVPMLAAQTRPDPLRQALEAAEQRWEEL